METKKFKFKSQAQAQIFQLLSRTMITLKNLCLLTCIFYSLSLKAQDTNFIKVDSFEIESDYFTTDPLQNIYVVTPSGIIQKYNVKGDLLFEYNNENFGKPIFIDATNPLRVLLFYSEYLTAIVLDRTLNELYTYNLIDYGINQVIAITSAVDNGLWLYDDWTYQIKKINRLGEIEVESNDLSQVLEEELSPIQIIFQNNKIYLFDQSEQVFIFDMYGQFIEKLKTREAKAIQVSEQFLFYAIKDKLHLIDFYNHSYPYKYIEGYFELPFEKTEEDTVRFENGTLFWKNDNLITIYK